MMVAQFFVQSTQVPERKFRIIALDKETMIATLEGIEATFEQKIDKATLTRLGYTITKEEVPDAEQP